MKHVVIVNGKPESGKTTFENECINLLDKSEMAHGHIWSSIDFIKEVYKSFGWDGVKTPKARKHLSELKKIWVETSNGPVGHILNKIIIELTYYEDHVVFVDIREENEIIEMSEILKSLRPIGITCTTMLVTREDCNGLEYGNKSDDSVGQNESLYEHIINNNGTVDELREQARNFIKKLLEE